MPTRQEVESEKQAALNKGVFQPIPTLVRLRCSLMLEECAHPRPQGIEQPGASLKAHWLLSLPTVGIVPPRTKSPAEEEMTPSSVVRRATNGLTNGLSSRVSAHLQALKACAQWP